MRRTFPKLGAEFQLPAPSKKAKPGPASPIDGGALVSRRGELAHTFGCYWGKIALALLTADSAKSCRHAFDFLRGSGSVENILRPFFAIDTIPCTSRELRDKRKKIKGVQNRLRKLYPQLSDARERVKQAQYTTGGDDLASAYYVRLQLDARGSEMQHLERLYASVEIERDKLMTELEAMEGHFAGEELFRFVHKPAAGKHRKPRYSLEPHNLASAMAGLPFIGWRESMKRCKKQLRGPVSSRDYRVFCAIRYIVGRADATAWDDDCCNPAGGFLVPRDEYLRERWTNHFRASVPSLRGDHLQVRDYLMENWYFLYRAIETALRAKPPTRHLPYLISDEFNSRASHQSAADVVRADGEKLKRAER